MIAFLFWTSVAAACATVYYNVKSSGSRSIGRGSSSSKSSSGSRHLTGV